MLRVQQYVRYQTDLPGVDVLKLVMAFAVIAIHAPEYLWPDNRVWPMWFEWFIRLAVPFFFIASGFLIQRKLEVVEEISLRRHKLLSKSRVIYKTWALWTLIYLPLTIWGVSKETTSLAGIIQQVIYDWTVCGHAVYAQHLWYVYSLGFVLAVWGMLNTLNDMRTIIVFIVVFFAIGCIQHLALLPSALSDVFRWIMGGGLPVFTGALLFKIINTRHLNVFQLLIFANILIILSLICFIKSIPFFSLLGGAGFFIIGYIVKACTNMNFQITRKESMWIYYLHMYLIIIAMALIRSLDLEVNRWFSLIVICVIMWFFAKTMTIISTMDCFKFLDRLLK